MADPDRPPGHRSLFDFGVRQVAEKQKKKKKGGGGRSSPLPRTGGCLEMMTWDDGWDVELRRASKPFGKSRKLMVAPSKSF